MQCTFSQSGTNQKQFSPGDFPALYNGLQWSHIFPRLTNRELQNSTNQPPSQAWHRLRVFPPFLRVTCFPALFTCWLFFRPLWWFLISSRWRRLHFFLGLITCFRALGTYFPTRVTDLTFSPGLPKGCTFLLNSDLFTLLFGTFFNSH